MSLMKAESRVQRIRYVLVERQKRDCPDSTVLGNLLRFVEDPESRAWIRAVRGRQRRRRVRQVMMGEVVVIDHESRD